MPGVSNRCAHQFQESGAMLRSPGAVTGKIEDFIVHIPSIVAIWICSATACGLANRRSINRFDKVSPSWSTSFKLACRARSDMARRTGGADLPLHGGRGTAVASGSYDRRVRWRWSGSSTHLGQAACRKRPRCIAAHLRGVFPFMKSTGVPLCTRCASASASQLVRRMQP